MPKRRAILSLILAMIALSSLLLWYRLPRWSAQAAQRLLTSFFSRASVVREVRFGLLPIRAEVSGVRVAGSQSESEPFIEAEQVTLIPAWRTLFTSRITLARVIVDGFVMRINTFTGGGDNIPKMGQAQATQDVDVLVRRLLVRRGHFQLNHRRVPVSVDLPEFSARLSTRRTSELAGRFSSRQGWVQYGEAPRLPISAEIDLVLGKSRLNIESARLITEGSQLSFNGSLSTTPDVRGVFQLSGPINLGELDRCMWRTGLGMDGNGRYEGSFEVHGSSVRLKGRISGTDGVLDGVPVERFAGIFTRNENGVHLRDWELITLGGTVSLNMDIPSAVAPVRLKTEFQRVDAEAAVRAIFDLGAFSVGARATGAADMTWPKSRTRLWSGRIAFDLESQASDGRTPLTGSLEMTANKGLQHIENSDLRTPATAIRLMGDIDAENRLNLYIEGGSTNLVATDDLGRRLRHAMGNSEAMVAGLSGRGTATGRCGGTMNTPVFVGRFSGSHIGYLDVDWGNVEWVGEIDAEHIESRSLVARRDGAELWIDGDIRTGFFGIQDALDIRVRFDNWLVDDFIKAFKWDVNLSGRATGDAAIRGRRSAPEGKVLFLALAGRCYGIAYENLAFTALLQGRETEVRNGSVRVGDGIVRFHGTTTDDEVLDIEAILDGVGLDALMPRAPGGTSWRGAVSGRTELRGTLTRPHIQASLDGQRLVIGGTSLGPFQLQVHGTGSGGVRVGGRLHTAQGVYALNGEVTVTPPFDSSVEIRAQNAALDPFMRWLAPSLPAGLQVMADGRLNSRGPFGQPNRLVIDCAAPRLHVVFPEYELRSSRPVRIQLENGIVHLRDIDFDGDGSHLSAHGVWPLLTAKEEAVDVKILGDLDLRVTSSLMENIRGRGQARLGLKLTGPSRAPVLDGTLDLAGAGLRFKGFPHGLEDLRGVIRLSTTAASFSQLRCRLGGGDVEARGELGYGAGRLRSVDIRVAGRKLALRYPEGLRSSIDADLRYYGDALRQWISGDILVHEAAWTRRYDVARELLAITPSTTAHVATLNEGVKYDVRIHAPSTLRVDNNLTTLNARAELQLRGSVDKPAILGRADIERGRVYFGGNTYVIRRGTIDFVNPQEIDPVFDIEAETFARSYRVTLKLSGTARHVQPILTSDPPLSPVQILSLLAGADESAVASLQRAQQEQTQLGATSAATLATGWISETVGLEQGVQKLRFLGLSRFSIDPKAINLALAEKGDVNPAARLTLGGRLNPDLSWLAGRRFTPDLSWLYVRDLGGQEERVLSLEYIVSDRLSLLLTRAERSGEQDEIGVDVLMRHVK